MIKQNKNPVRRIVTGHDAAGQAAFVSDRTFDPVDIPGGDAAMCLIWTAPDLPVDNDDTTDGREREAGLTLRGGSVIRTVDIYPGQQSPFHRTNSLDYGIVLNGELELELDGGAKVILHAGDIVVQRGTIHLWRNPSLAETCRIVFVLTEAKPATVNGSALAEIHP